MARYAKRNGVAERKHESGGRVVAELTPELQWQVAVEGVREDLQGPLSDAWKDMLEMIQQVVLAREGGTGGVGPQFGTVQAFVLRSAAHRLGFGVIQWPQQSGEGEPGVEY